MSPEDVATFERCIAVGGVALFPADTVYGLATDPDSREGVERLYRLKGRRPDRPAAVMFFQLELALAALPELGGRTRAALERLLPGGVTLVVPNPGRRYPLACGPDSERLGLRGEPVDRVGRKERDAADGDAALEGLGLVRGHGTLPTVRRSQPARSG